MLSAVPTAASSRRGNLPFGGGGVDVRAFSRPRAADVVCAIALGLLVFLCWTPPGFYGIATQLKWYIMLAVAGVVFLLSGGRLDLRAERGPGWLSAETRPQHH